MFSLNRNIGSAGSGISVVFVEVELLRVPEERPVFEWLKFCNILDSFALHCHANIRSELTGSATPKLKRLFYASENYRHFAPDGAPTMDADDDPGSRIFQHFWTEFTQRSKLSGNTNVALNCSPKKYLSVRVS